MDKIYDYHEGYDRSDAYEIDWRDKCKFNPEYPYKIKLDRDRGIMKRKRSAKDIAFDKERANFRKKIREFERKLSDRDSEIRQLKELINQKEIEISEKEDWIQRLLEYMDLSEDDLKNFIKNEKIKDDIYNGFEVIEKIFSKYLGSFFG